jgi:hypothetical protein
VPTPLRESLTLEPDPSRWVELVHERRPRAPSWLTTAASTFRPQLGLPKGPVVMSGHQAVLWHPGILAKYIATDACARAAGASPAWVVVDQDTPAPDEIAWPMRADESGKRIIVGTRRFEYVMPYEADVPAVRRPVMRSGRPPDDDRLVDPSLALGRLLAAIDATSDAPNAAAQVTRVIEALLPPTIARVPAFDATSMASTDLFAAIVGRMHSDPRRCIESYNAAALAHPEADIRPLDAGALELPLWHIDGPAGRATRRAVHAGELTSIPRSDLAPRALLMTALLRLAACDLFVHGTGGMAYDRVTDAWLAAWLGPDAVPAPTALATATLLLPLDTTPEDEAVTAQHLYRASLHKPDSLGDNELESQRRALVAGIAAAPYRSEHRRHRYRDLQQLLARYREVHAPEIEARRRAALAARSSARDHAASVRTWAFPLYSAASLARLRDDIHRAFGRVSAGDTSRPPSPSTTPSSASASRPRTEAST